MDNVLEPVVAAMAGGIREQIGWFEYDVPSDSWTWSPGLYEMHGFHPGEIVPTTDIFVAHKHPEDRVHTDAVLAAVLATGQPFCCRHRIVTSRQEVRTVVTIGQGSLDARGQVALVRGYFVDITDAAVRASKQEIQEAVEMSAASRADIEQAKGALMAVQGISDGAAFEVLRWHASHANIKLREVARTIVAGMQSPSTQSETADQRISRLLSGIVPGHPDLSGAPGAHEYQ